MSVTRSSAALPARLEDLAQLAVMLGLAAVLSVALFLQLDPIAAILPRTMLPQWIVAPEIPCPLCLLERVAMFGICLGPILHFRHGASARHDGIGLVAAVLLLVISVRQVLLDICPRPGHAYIGNAVLGLHMPVWSVVIAAAILAAYAMKLTLLGDVGRQAAPASPVLAKAGGITSLYVVALGLANLVAVGLQCGIEACHTTGYRLLGGG